MTNFKYEVDQDGIALITWDMPGRSMNVLNADVLAELQALLDKTTADAGIKGVVVTTGKDTFSGVLISPCCKSSAASSSRSANPRVRKPRR